MSEVVAAVLPLLLLPLAIAVDVADVENAGGREDAEGTATCE